MMMIGTLAIGSLLLTDINAPSGQELVIQERRLRAASPVREATSATCGERQVTVSLERDLDRGASERAQVMLEIDGRAHDVTHTEFGSDLDVRDGVLRLFIACRASGFLVNAFGFRVSSERAIEGVRSSTSFDDEGRLLDHSGLMQTDVASLSSSLD